MENRPIVLELVHLSRRFGSTVAVANASLRTEAGEMIGIIGRSGAGKSTLLRLINRMIDPTEGSIRAGGTDITALRGKALRRWRARTAMIFQQFNLVPPDDVDVGHFQHAAIDHGTQIATAISLGLLALTLRPGHAGRLDVLTNVLCGRLHDISGPLCGRLHDISGPRMLLKLFSEAERVEAINALDRMGLAELAMNRADALSGGQQQRVAIARALIQRPDIILADEPIASLDPMNAKVVMDALADINQRDGITVLCNLHTLDTARAYCGRIIGMAGGRIVFDGSPAQLTDPVLRDIYGDHASGSFDERITSTSLPAAVMPAMART